MFIITSMDHLLASPLGMYQPYLIHTLSIKVSTRFHQLSKTKLGLSLTFKDLSKFGYIKRIDLLLWVNFKARGRH
jgi:hypothetical protein